MLGIQDFWLFIVSGLLLNVTPGPDTAYIVGRSVQIGWRGGAAAALGISTGCLVHVFGAAIGLSALLAASSAAFTLVKWAGAAYLCFMGVKMLLSHAPAPKADEASAGGAVSLRQVFWQGALTNALNPKVALFFLAFLPQFVALDSPHRRRRLPAARPDFHLQRHALVPWRGSLRRASRRPCQAVRPGAALDQSRAGRAVRLSRRPHGHASGALGSVKRASVR